MVRVEGVCVREALLQVRVLIYLRLHVPKENGGILCMSVALQLLKGSMSLLQ